MSDLPAHMGQFKAYHPPWWSINALIHRLWGRRRAFSHPFAVILKGKEFPDVSFYQGPIDWNKMRMKTDTVIIRAGQNLWVDTQFERNWFEAKIRGMLRGTYWFYDDRIDPGRQADLWISQMRNDPPEMECVIDWEKSYGGAFSGLGNVVACMQRVEQAGFHMGFYTGYYWFIGNSNPMTNAGQYNYLKSKPLWLAWYTTNPANVLIPQPWADLLIWQHSTPAVGSEYGVQTTEIDMNWFNGTGDEFYYRYGDSPPAQPIPYGYIQLRRFDSDTHIVKLDSFERALVTNTGGRLQTVSATAQAHGAQYAINGDGWNLTEEPKRPLSLAASDGNLYQNIQYDYRPFLNIDRNGDVAVAHNINNVERHNLVSGTRYLVQAGMNFFANSTNPEHITERNPRSAAGHTADGKLILCVVDGRSMASEGVTLKELAEILIEAGANWAIELDGGGSSALWAQDRIVNVPSDGRERAVINHLLIYTEATMPTRYEATAIGDGTRLRPDHNTDNTYLATYPRNTRFHGDNLFTATKNLYNAQGTLIQEPGDVWLQVTDVDDTAKAGWVAITHMGGAICNLVDNAPPPPAESIYISHTFTDILIVNGKTYDAVFTVPNVEYKPRP